MNISYLGRLMIESWDYHKECTVRRFDPKSNPQAQIFYRDKEQSMFDFIDSALDKAGYSAVFYGGDDYDQTNWAWYVVEDREEYNDFKELYHELKRQYKEINKKSHISSDKIYAVFISAEGVEIYYGRTPLYEQAKSCVNNLAKRGVKAVIKDWKGEEKDGQ